VGDRVGYTTRSHKWGGSYADFTVVNAHLAAKLPDSISTHDAAAVFLQGLTALSQATVDVADEIKPGELTEPTLRLSCQQDDTSVDSSEWVTQSCCA